MKTPNTSKQYGGVVTKLKDKWKRLGITVLLLVLGLMACRMALVLLDQFMNGFFVDWFEENYVMQKWTSLDENGAGYYTKLIRWGMVKELLLKVLIVLVFAVILTVRTVSIFYADYRERKALHSAGRMIGEYMRHDREAGDVFPPAYAEVAAQMTEIRSGIQRQEQLLREEAGRKNDLITYLAHDLKTPLTSVVGYLSLLEEAPDMPEAQKAKYVHTALNKALRLESLINEFFEITRYNLQQIVLEKETVDLSFLMVQLTDEFYPILAAHGNTVRLEQDGKLTVSGDGEKLARVFNNILKNAVAYSYPGTEIEILCEKKDHMVRIRFRNRGKTIPRQKLEAIFEKFFRLDDARSTNTGGAGLGLAIAREIVSLHGGTIKAESADEVTVFTVELPQ